MRNDAWELGCRSSCLRWIDRLPTSQLVGISRRQGSSLKKYADGDVI